MSTYGGEFENYGISGNQNYLPSISLVAQHIKARTLNKYGRLLGTFSAETTPSDTDVLAIILTAATKVADEIGDQVPEAVVDDAADLVALRAAMMIELSYFSQQISTDRSPYSQLRDEYERELPRLLAAVESAEHDEEGDINDPPSPNTPSYSFPPSGKITLDGTW